MRPTAANYIRLVTLHEYCWRTGKRQWAKAIGQKLKEFLIDNPQFRTY